MNEIPLKIKNVLNDFINGVNEILGTRAKKIILYGSYARGDFNKHSDIDIMILSDLSEDEWYEYFSQISDMAYDIELKNNVIISPLLKNIDNFNYWLEALPFYMNVDKEGVLLK